ncbi:MAG: glycosyltransferase family 39 protein, partial [Planctomycetes bacterium]|nr:glycosyltransferase family 39 protein [Planctomycetota bacterium]
MTEECPRKTAGLVATGLAVLLLVGALVYSGCMMSRAFDGYFKRGYLGHNGARYSIMARNVLRADLTAVNFVPLLNAAEDREYDHYLHHPPLLHWVIALSFYWFGENENNARAIPFVFTLLNLAALYCLGKLLFGNPVAGGFAAVIGASLPLTSYYGSHIDVQGSPLVFFILATVLCYLKWLEGGKKIYYGSAVLCLAVGTLFDWPALYLCLLLPLHHWFTHRSSGGNLWGSFKKLGPLIGVGFLLFSALFIWLSTAGDPKGTTLIESIVHRTVKPSTFLDIGNPWRYVWDHCSFPKMHTLCPWPYLALVFIGWILGRFSGPLHRSSGLGRALWLFFILGAMHLFIFPFGALFHDYWIFLCLPWVALAGSSAVCRIIAVVNGGRTGARRVLSWLTGACILGLLLLSGHIYADQRFKEDIEIEPYLLGKKIHDNVAPGLAVMINADHYNQPVPGKEDRYVLFKPELSYYADRVIRGHIQTVEMFKDVLQRRDDFAYFIFIKHFKNHHPELYDYLEKNYPMEKEVYPGLLFFQL